MKTIINKDLFVSEDENRLYIKETEFNKPLVEWIRETQFDDFNREMLRDEEGVFRIYYTNFIVEKIKTKKTLKEVVKDLIDNTEDISPKDIEEINNSVDMVIKEVNNRKYGN